MALDLAILREPGTGSQLRLDGDALVSDVSGRRFTMKHEIPCFVDSGALGAQNAKFQRFYDRIAPGYDAVEAIWAFVKRLDRRSVRSGYLDELEISDGGRVLEVSIGTGVNVQWLPDSAEIAGLDLSMGMLTRCRRRLARVGRHATLVQGTAESLPFADRAFDCVFHFGGINFFDDPARAIREMIRVAKPGTIVVISDETEEHVRKTYERQPGASKYFADRTQPVRAPIDLLPEGLEEVRHKEFFDGRMYCIRFRTPV